MSYEHYFLAWSFYLVAAVGCLAVWYRMTRNIPWRFCKLLMRGVALVVLLTPWPVSEGEPSLGVAALVAIFDGLSHGPESMLRAGTAIIALLSLLMFMLFVDLVWAAIKRRKQSAQALKEQPSESGAEKLRIDPQM